MGGQNVMVRYVPTICNLRFAIGRAFNCKSQINNGQKLVRSRN